MSFDLSLAAANELFVADDYEAAAPLYDAALQQQPNNVAALIARAANSIKRKQYNGHYSVTPRTVHPRSLSYRLPPPLLPPLPHSLTINGGRR